MSNAPSDSLDSLTIASPCSADWETMHGNNQVRFCDQCQLNVYNLSAMTSEAALELIQAREGKLCVRLFKRDDGSVITQDCPVGLKIKRRQHIRRWGKIAAAITIATTIGLFTVKGYCESRTTMGEVMITPNPVDKPPTVLMGAPTVMPTDYPIPNQDTKDNPDEVENPPKTDPDIIMGKIKVDPCPNDKEKNKNVNSPTH